MRPDPWTRGRALLTIPSSEPPARFAFPFTTRAVTVSLPPATVGSYVLLGQDGNAIYVGRSDHCLRRRLLQHPLRSRASHFSASVVDTPRSAYLLESYWWHRYRRDGIQLINRIHPAGHEPSAHCPFCDYPASHVQPFAA